MNTFRKILALAVLLANAVLHPATLAQQSDTPSISFQGVLNGPNGQPLPNNFYDLTFRFYSDTSTPLAMATSNVPNVSVTNGLTSTPIPVDAAWFNGKSRYLGISIAGMNGGRELAPRVQITSVPYALNAKSLGDGSLFVGANGNVGIGTTNPLNQIHISGRGVIDSPPLRLDQFGHGEEFGVMITEPDSQSSARLYMEGGTMTVSSGRGDGAGTPPAFRVRQRGEGFDAGIQLDSPNSEHSTRIFMDNGLFAIKQAGMSTGFALDTSGNVGLGLDHPQPGRRLDVLGSAKIRGALYVGTGVNDEVHGIVIEGPNSPPDAGSAQPITWRFDAGLGNGQASVAEIRGLRGGSWDTFMEFWTSGYNAGPNSPGLRMRVDGEGIDVIGRTRTRVLQIVGGADLAEPLNVNNVHSCDEFKVEPGMVVSIDPTGNRKFKLSDEPYDRKRVGIISGGHGVQPGLILRDEGNPQADGEQPIALTGQVWCHADATLGPIVPGDLLTTSSTPGHAMKVTDDSKARFAVLGQALTTLKEGRGWVQVLVGKQ